MSARCIFRLFWVSVLAIILFFLFVAVLLTSSVVLGFKGSADLAAGQGTLLRQGFGGQGGGTVCGLVFGAAVHRSSLPGPGITRRVGTATRLYHEGILQHIILSGGKGEDGMASEAEVMRDVALENEIPAGDLTLEDQSRSTWENLLNSRPLAGSCTTVIGISDRYHLARIAYLARRQGWEDVRTLPSDIEAPWYFEVRSISREVAAILYYMVITHVYPIDEISQHDIPDTIEQGLLGLVIT
ncbi:MAG: YdcF family protein [Candidatus Peregrinibacteria bacterium]